VTDQGGDNKVVAVAQRDPWMAEVVAQLDHPTRLQQLRSLLGSDAAVERFKTVALHSVVHDQPLRNVEPMSIVEAVREAAVLQLDVYGPLGEAWILPYGKTARLSIGYRGLLKLIRRSNQVSFIDAQIVYMQDEFDVEFGTAPRIVHRPLMFGERDAETGAYLADRGSYRGAYAWAQLAGAPFPLIEWMPLADIEQVRKASPGVKAGRKTPWDDWYSEMARKSPLRRLSKRLPLDPVAAQALAYESETDEMEHSTQPATPARSSASRALAALPAGYRTAPEPTPNVAAGAHKGLAAEAEGSGELTPGAVPADGSAEPADAPEGHEIPTQTQAEPESKPAPRRVNPAPPRPAAPVDEDDADLASLVSNVELGGEG
jgi:phage RecT family recombinase